MMKLRISIAIMMAVAFLAAAVQTAGAHGGYANCGAPFDGATIIAKGTSCEQARAVMQKVYIKGQEGVPADGVLHARGWSCTLAPSKYRAITCRRGSGVIKGPTPGS